jgi:hypothetical protein
MLNNNKYNYKVMYLPFEVSLAGVATENTLIKGAFSSDRVWGRQIDVGRLFKESDLEMEFLRHSLGRTVAVAWPHDILYIQTFLLPRFPYSDLWKESNSEMKYISEMFCSCV